MEKQKFVHGFTQIFTDFRRESDQKSVFILKIRVQNFLSDKLLVQIRCGLEAVVVTDCTKT
jgi:hypothetical protein